MVAFAHSFISEEKIEFWVETAIKKLNLTPPFVFLSILLEHTEKIISIMAVELVGHHYIHLT